MRGVYGAPNKINIAKKHIFGVGATEDVRSYDVADIGDDDSAEFFCFENPPLIDFKRYGNELRKIWMF